MGRKERTKRTFCCTIFKVFFIAVYLTRGISLMKLFFWFSFTRCSLLPKSLSSFSSLPFYLYLYSSVPRILCAYLASSYLFPSASSLMALFFFLSFLPPHLTSHFVYVPISPRWIIAQRMAQQTQVQIMSSLRERCFLSLARPSKVKKKMTQSQQ